MKLKIIGISAIIGLFLVLCSPKSENSIRKTAAQLHGPHGGSCSAVQVKTHSGENYLLTAAHCKILEDKTGSIRVTPEGGKDIMRRVIAEDEKSDLLLLEPIPGIDGLDIAEYSPRGNHIRTFTNGAGLPLYKTDGILIADEFIKAPLKEIVTEKDEASCNKEKNSIDDILLGGFFPLKMCLLSVYETISTAFIKPGSSGGMVVDDSGKLVGIVSAGGDYAAFVRLVDIQNFLHSY